MRVNVAFLPSLIKPEELDNVTCIVLDIFRATGSIITAGINGCEAIIPLCSIEEALSMKKQSPHSLLAGERQSIKIEGFDFGNSPAEFSQEKVQSNTIIMTTSNGTNAIKSTLSNKTFIGAFLNADSVCRKAAELQNDILIICAGTEKTFSLEDALCAGYMVNFLQEKYDTDYTDSSLAALMLYNSAKNSLIETATQSKNGERLVRLNLYEDILYCFQQNITTLVPEYKDGKIKFN